MTTLITTTTVQRVQSLLLLIAGGLLILVAATILAAPTAFYAANGIELGANVSLLNELKAPAGFLLAAGVLMIGAIVIRSMTAAALLLATLIYLSYAASRFVSMALDGVPATGLVQAAALETVVGLACLTALLIPGVRVGKTAGRTT